MTEEQKAKFRELFAIAAKQISCTETRADRALEAYVSQLIVEGKELGRAEATHERAKTDRRARTDLRAMCEAWRLFFDILDQWPMRSDVHQVQLNTIADRVLGAEA